MSNGPTETNDSDWLKYYCIVFGLLILVVGVLYLKIDGDLDDYKAANRAAEQSITGDGLRSRRAGRTGRPLVLDDLAVEVHQYVTAYREAIGGLGAESDIPDDIMIRAGNREGANMTWTHAGGVDIDRNRSKNYQTIKRDFSYESCKLDQLVALMFNVENLSARLRVQEVTWTLMEKKENSEPPFNMIRKPRITVAFREPLKSDR